MKNNPIIDYIKTHKGPAVVAGWPSISLIIIVLALVFGVGRSGEDHEDGWPGYSEFMEGNTFAMSNRYDLSAVTSNEHSMIVFGSLEKVVIDQTEIGSAPHGNEVSDDLPRGYYLSAIRDLESHSNPNDARGRSSIVSFSLEISDGRIYQVKVLISDSNGYIAVLITRGSERYWLFINGREGLYDDSSEPDIFNWVESLGVDRSSLKVEQINLPRSQ